MHRGVTAGWGSKLRRLISASAQLSQPPERVYAFLADLRNHWLLSRRFAVLEELDGDAAGGRVRVRGPLGLSRVARTRVLEAVEPRELRGRAEVGRGTVGAVRWLIEPSGSGSLVMLSAEVQSARGIDRAVLALGGTWWLQRMFTEAVEQLGRVA